jgi:hypothetical protein
MEIAMNRIMVVAACCFLMTGPAFAAGGCSRAPASKFKPKATLAHMLAREGYTVRRIKVENGCYEVYALDKHGRRYNAAYNAETFKKMANAEAGER